MDKFDNFSEYIKGRDKEIISILEKLRSIILESDPNAEESISYGMPAYKTYGRPLVYFAAFSKHIGLYATPSGHEAFTSQLKEYKQGKGSVQFPLDKPMPYDLIREIVNYRVKENRAKFAHSKK